jgi:hypothetical protein
MDAAVPVDADTLWTDCEGPVRADVAFSCPLLRVSRDAGVTWTSVSLPGLGDTGSADLLVVPTFSSGFHFISPTEGYVAVQETGARGTRTHYFRSPDGGRTWSEVALVEGQRAWAAPIFLDSQHWFQPGLSTVLSGVDGSGVAYVNADGMNATSDGGKTWRNVGASMGSLDRVWMWDTQYGVAVHGVDNDSPLYLTSDGGQSWQPAMIGPGQYPNPSFAWVTAPPMESGMPDVSPSAARSITPSAARSISPSAEPSASPAVSVGATAGN